jgi:hypothetical protein
MDSFVCDTCGTAWPPSAAPPAACPICLDERQYLPPGGQRWTTLSTLRGRRRQSFRYEHRVLGLAPEPPFAIGQRALLVRSPGGNVLWDCVSLIDRGTAEILSALGGIDAIAISHPHYYSAMADWSAAFDAPVYTHADDAGFVVNKASEHRFWEGERLEILPGLTLVRCGGHFEGATVLHSAHEPGGALFTGDVLQVAPDGEHLGFMRSYPNYVPLGAGAVRRIEAALAGLEFEAIYGAFWDRVIPRGGREALSRSVERHVDWVTRE